MGKQKENIILVQKDVRGLYQKMNKCKNCGHEEKYHSTFDKKQQIPTPYELQDCFYKDCPCKKFEEENGCGKRIDDLIHAGMYRICGKNDYLCEECKNPKNHSPSVLTKTLEDTPEDCRLEKEKSDGLNKASGTFNLSDKYDMFFGVKCWRKVHVKTFVKMLKEADNKIMCDLLRGRITIGEAQARLLQSRDTLAGEELV